MILTQLIARIFVTLCLCCVVMKGVAFGVSENATQVAQSFPVMESANETDDNLLRIVAKDILDARDDSPPNLNHSLRCIPNPCLKGRVCTVIPNGYRCQCPDGWMGQQCITRITCSTNNPCLNNGQCYDSGMGLLRCFCLLGFTGPRCEHEVATPCDSAPCTEGKICVEYGPASYRCRCPDGYTGENCNVTKVSCIPNLCENNGTCIALLGSGHVSCLCQDDYLGERCEIKDPCKPSPCVNGGKCAMDKIAHTGSCNCPEGFRGGKCEKIVTEMCALKGCINNEKCVYNNGTEEVECKCMEGYHGSRCEYEDKCNPNPCLHAGSCRMVAGDAVCLCRQGFGGDKCELHECNPNPCLNGGVCTAVPGTGDYNCFCSYGYKGHNCEFSPCFFNPCTNGGTCTTNRSSSPWYVCQCLPGWKGENCDIPPLRKTVDHACDPDPCNNGCQCKPSCRHENGYICVGSEGQLGKNCDLPAPIIKCGPSQITVTIDSQIIAEYGGKFADFDVFMSNTSSIVSKPSCPATGNGTDLQVVLTLPFDQCGTVTSTMSDGKMSVTNTIWMNKLLAIGKAEVPIPVVRFICQYDVEYNVVTSLSPSLGYTRSVVAKGKRTVPAVIELCKSGHSCPQPCPARYSLRRGAVYTVGERLHFRISPETKGDTLRIQDLFLSCLSDLSEEQSTAPVILIVSECLPKISPRYNPTEVTQFRDGLCISFRVPFLAECGVFYIHAKLRSCNKNCNSSYGVCAGRSRRNVIGKESLQVFGPIHVLRGNDGVLMSTIYPGDDNILDTNSSRPAEDVPKVVEGPNVLIKIAVAIIVLGVLLAVGLIATQFCFRRRWFNLKCDC